MCKIDPGIKTGGFIGKTVRAVVALLMESVSNEEMATRPGFLQLGDPRLKCLSAALLLLAVLLSKNSIALAGICLLCTMAAAFSRINPLFFLGRTLLFIPLFSLFIVVPAIFSFVTPGESVAGFSVAGHAVSITRQGIDSAIMLFFRIFASVSLSVLLVITTRHHALLKALRVFKVPRIFVMTMGMSYRYIYLFLEIVQNNFAAIVSRVGGITSHVSGQRIVAFNMGGLWLKSYRLQNQVYDAMLSRGYTGEPQVLEEFHPRISDYGVLIFSLFGLLGMIWLNRFFH